MVSSAKPVVCIVTPGTRSANNGNWRTAARWASMLRGHSKVIVQTRWDGSRIDALIALHAARSADSIAACHEADAAPVAVVLSGTDLYRDLPDDLHAVRSLDYARRIVVLQDDALRLLKAPWRRKAEVIFQSAPARRAGPKPRGTLRCVAVGHLRAEKDPQTLFSAFEKLPRDLPITFRHIGAPLDESLARAARDLQSRDKRFRYGGPLSHRATLAAIASAHVLVHPSRMEGGANVIVEAVMARTPVIASRMSGNVGMLGGGYPGYFPVGSAQGLARCLSRAVKDPAYLRALSAGCTARRPLFDPRKEQAAVRRLVEALIA